MAGAGPLGAIIGGAIGGLGGTELYNILLDPQSEMQERINEALRNLPYNMNERWQWLRDHPDYLWW